MRILLWVLISALAAVMLSVFGCNRSTTLDRPQPPYKSNDIDGGHGSGSGGTE